MPRGLILRQKRAPAEFNLVRKRAGLPKRAIITFVVAALVTPSHRVHDIGENVLIGDQSSDNVCSFSPVEECVGSGLDSVSIADVV